METELAVSDLDKELESYLNKGYRLDMIMPADSPTTARVSKNGETILLQSPVTNETVSNSDKIIVTRSDDTSWVSGRAGMQYRDLIPGRVGGRVIASHIRLTEGGVVPDYVHYHKVLFQMIYCKAGWIRVVYEDQGPPFILNAGDCVLQPAEIRHRVLESSAGAEVIEIGCPAVHETWVDHDLQLPNGSVQPDRIFSGQRFVRHIAADAEWQASDSYQYRDTSISAATNDLAQVSVRKCESPNSVTYISNDELLFYFVLNGELTLTANKVKCLLRKADSFVITAAQEYTIQNVGELEILEVSLMSNKLQFVGYES